VWLGQHEAGRTTVVVACAQLVAQHAASFDAMEAGATRARSVLFRLRENVERNDVIRVGVRLVRGNLRWLNPGVVSLLFVTASQQLFK